MTEFEQRLDTLIMMLADPNITINPSGFAKIKENLLSSAKEGLWHDAQGDDLPEIDREVIVLTQPYPLEGSEYAVRFAHRPVESYTGVSIINHSEMEEYYPEKYGKGGWNIPDVKWWLDVELPNLEKQQ